MLRGLVLRDAGLHGLRCAVDQVLGFLEAKTRDLAHDLDDLDLLAAGFLEDDVELGLLFNGRGRAAAPPPAGAPPTGAAAMVTLNLLLKASISSASSKTDMLPIASRISSLLMVVAIVVILLVLLKVGQTMDRSGHCCGRSLTDFQALAPARFALHVQRFDGSREILQQAVHRAGEHRPSAPACWRRARRASARATASTPAS